MQEIILTFIKDIFSKNQIPFRITAVPNTNWDWLDHGLRTHILGMENFAEQTNHWFMSHHETAVHHSVDLFQCNYTTIKFPNSNNWLVIGPVLYEEIADIRFNEIFDSLKLDECLREPLQNYYYHIKFIPYRASFENFISIIANHIYHSDNYKTIYRNAQELDEWYQNFTYYQSKLKPSISSLKYNELYLAEENALLASISIGNERQAIFHYVCMQSFKTATTSNIRMKKNECLKLNALFYKTAEQNSISFTLLYPFFQFFEQQIEQASNFEQLQKILYTMIRNYCKLISESSLKDYSETIRLCILFIQNDLSSDLSLKTIAHWINVNPSYLSSRFKKETGFTLTDYVNLCRIKLAKKLLLSTNSTIRSISLQCGITDIRYFSRIFKKFTGTTPSLYRETASYDECQNLISPSLFI